MAVDERERNALHNRLTEVLGEDAAVTLMRHLPPTGWGDVATKQDLHTLAERLESRMEIQFAELEGKITGVEGKITGVEGKIAGVEGKIAGVEGRITGMVDGKIAEVASKIAGLEGKISGVETNLLREMARQTRIYMFAMLTAVVMTAGIAFGAAGLN